MNIIIHIPYFKNLKYIKHISCSILLKHLKYSFIHIKYNLIWIKLYLRLTNQYFRCIIYLSSKTGIAEGKEDNYGDKNRYSK